MTNAIIVGGISDQHGPDSDAVPVTWARPAWVTSVDASDGYVLYAGDWMRPATQQVHVRLVSSDGFSLCPDGSIVAEGEPAEVELRVGNGQGRTLHLSLEDALALSGALRVLYENGKAGR
jgi:hypothetical protein